MAEAVRGSSNADLARERDRLLVSLIETLERERRCIRAGQEGITTTGPEEGHS